MQPLKAYQKPFHSSRITALLAAIISSLCLLYLLVPLLIYTQPLSPQPTRAHAPTTLHHIAFGIASSAKSWPTRRDYVSTWWDPRRTRGCVFLEEPLAGNLAGESPPVCVSEDTSRFRYTFRGGQRSAIRVARIVKETVALNLTDVRWFVFGDDDTVFFPENLAKTLEKYDHGEWYYVGTNSEIYEQNAEYGLGMAFGGAGFAMSYPLAKVVAKVLDSCIERYPHVYGSDSRVYSCVAELGVGLTRELGFHQMDLRGNMFGLLASHPVTPLVSLHHLDHTDPIFPGQPSPKDALALLSRAASADSQRLLQQTVCYDKWYGWTVVVSWGFAVQIHGRHVQLPDLSRVPETFRKWKNRNTVLSGVFTFPTALLHPEVCRRPTVFFFEDVDSSPSRGIETTYRRENANCSADGNSPRKLDKVRVFSKKLDLDIKQLQAPRRHCCDVLPSVTNNVMDIAIRECHNEELIHMP